MFPMHAAMSEPPRIGTRLEFSERSGPSAGNDDSRETTRKIKVIDLTDTTPDEEREFSSEDELMRLLDKGSKYTASILWPGVFFANHIVDSIKKIDWKRFRGSFGVKDAWVRADDLEAAFFLILHERLDLIKRDNGVDLRLWSSSGFSLYEHDGFDSVRRHFESSITMEYSQLHIAEYVVLPLNLGSGKHWALGVIDKKNRKVIVYDSLFCEDRTLKSAESLFCFYRDLIFFKTHKRLPRSNWQICASQKTQQQGDGCSCGIFCLRAFECVVDLIFPRSGLKSGSLPNRFPNLFQDVNTGPNAMRDILVEMSHSINR